MLTVATLTPLRSIEAFVVNFLTSSSLCVMNNIEHPLLESFSKTSNSLAISWGVSTDVGSSIINNSGS